MDSQLWNRSVVISAGLAAVGILACVGILLDMYYPTGSILAFLSKTVFLALAIVGVLAAFVHLCDWCEDKFEASSGASFAREDCPPKDRMDQQPDKTRFKKRGFDKEHLNGPKRLAPSDDRPGDDYVGPADGLRQRV